MIERLPCHAAGGMNAGWISRNCIHYIVHGLSGLDAKGCGGTVVEIDHDFGHLDQVEYRRT